MFRVAVCDDNRVEVDFVLQLLANYQANRNNVEIQMDSFDCGEKLLEKIESDTSEKSCSDLYDLFLLDIFMEGLSGIDIARKLREKYTDVQIVFMTSSPDYTYDAFKLWAAQYLLKPVRKDELFDVLDKLLITREVKEDKFFLFKTPESIIKIPLRSIVYVEHSNHFMNAYLQTGEVITSKSIRVSFQTAIASLLEDRRFICPHTSFVINMERVEELTGREFIMEGNHAVPIPRYKYSAVKSKFLDWLMEKGGQK